MNQTWKNSKKPSFGQDFGLVAQIRAANFFSKIWLRRSLDRYYGRLSPCSISEKTNDPILEKLEKTDGQTGGQTDESDFIGRCPANVERPKCFVKRSGLSSFLYDNQITEDTKIIKIYSRNF